MCDGVHVPDYLVWDEIVRGELVETVRCSVTTHPVATPVEESSRDARREGLVEEYQS